MQDRNTNCFFRHLCLMILLGVLGCSVHKVNEKVEIPQAIPQHFSNSGALPLPEKWWESFSDPTLDALIEEGLATNLNLRAQAARLLQADALARKVGAAKIPSLDLDLRASRGKASIGDRSLTDNRFLAGLSASYELDLWKRISSLENAAALDAVAARETMEALALVLSAQIADSWYTVVEQHAQLELLNKQRQVSKTVLDLVELRFAQGQASAVDVYQQREQLASTETQIPPVKSRLTLATHRLAILLALPPNQAEFSTRLETAYQALVATSATTQNKHFSLEFVGKLPALEPAADVLLSRPDVRAAQARLIATDYRVAAAIADRFPTLRLSASGSYENNEFKDLFHDAVWNLASGLLTPLIDGGRRRAEVDRSRALLDETRSLYETTVLEAIGEVENALEQELNQREFIKRLGQQLSFSRSAFRESRSRYATGLTPYLTVLTILQTVQRTERLYLAAQKELISFRINLYKSLGGAWTQDLQVDENTPLSVSLKETEQ